jgi:hypothetical protein
MLKVEEIYQLLVQKPLSLQEKNDVRQQLVIYINQLLVEDFPNLVQLLYRVDISENKLKLLLQENKDTDAAEIITDLLIKRQEEKQRMKEEFRKNDKIEDDEKW